MSQFDYIKDIARQGLENDQKGLIDTLYQLIEYSKKTNKANFAIQLQSILKDAIQNQRTSGLSIVGSQKHTLQNNDLDVRDFIIEKLTSDYRFEHLICSEGIKEELRFFVEEHKMIDLLRKYELPVANKVFFHGPSGCGKTLASYVLAGELGKIMVVINLGAIVSSKLGETSKNLAKIFRKAASEECIIFIDEFDSIGKLRDYDQDHGEMKRVVNTILQLFDYLPQNSIVIAATNHPRMVDDALLRRFDLKINLGLPSKEQIKILINKTLKSGLFKLDRKVPIESIISKAEGLSYYTIQKTLINTIKRSLLRIEKESKSGHKPIISTSLWIDLLKKEKDSSESL